MNSISRALDHLLRAIGDPIRDLDGIGPDHPGHLYAEVIRAAVGVLAKIPAALPAISRATRDADVPGGPPRLRSHLEAARLWVHGDAALAARAYADILGHWPRDLLAMRLAQSCYFFIGQPERTCDLADEVMKQWRRDAPGFGFMLAMASFAHAESNHADRAEQLGRDALARDPACPMGVHAVAHAIAQSGRPGAGARWMRAQREHWAIPSRMRTHNAWHLAMFDVDDERTASALAILDTCLLRAAQTSPVDACDATVLLWRLAAKGLDVGNRWLSLSDAFERIWQPGFWPFVDVHAAMVHLRAGNGLRADRLARSVEIYAAENHPIAIRARKITVPILRAINVWNSGHHRAALAPRKDLRSLLDCIGGSRVQTQMFANLQNEAVPREHEPSSPIPLRLAGEDHVNHYRQTHRGSSVQGTEAAARQELD
jgi:hypothetical protein